MLIEKREFEHRSYKPIGDEGVTFNGTVARPLNAEYLEHCSIFVIRFDGGEGRIRLSAFDASATEGFIVATGDTIFFTRLEGHVLSGIRVGSTDLTGWVTYYA